MPQLDIYIVENMVLMVIFYYWINLLINWQILLINICINIQIKDLAYLLEKKKIKKIYKEIYFLKNKKYLKRILFLKNIYLKIINKIFFENLMDNYTILIKYFSLLKKKNYILLKNNIDFNRILF
jgi:hypothetical protein